MLDALGWVATAVFSASYFFRSQTALRWIQAAAACLWIAYGVAIGARPVVVANLIVAAAAAYSSTLARQRRTVRSDSVNAHQAASRDPVGEL